MKRVLSVLVFLLISTTLHANGAINGFCETGNQTVALGGLTSSTKVQRSFPSCTITVYINGTVTLATIFSDSANTPLANPFVASATGSWVFYASNGSYDVVKSGGGLTSPVTVRALIAFDPSVATGLVLDCLSPVYGTGADIGVRLGACQAALPATGGVMDGRGFQGSWTQSTMVSITKPTQLLLCGITVNVGIGTAFSSTAALEVNGCGTDQTKFIQTSSSTSVFHHVALDSFKLRDITFEGFPQVSGSAIVLDSPSDSNEGSIIENSEFSNQWDAIDLRAAAAFNITQNNFHGMQHRGVKIANHFNQDQTTGVISNNLFSCAVHTGKAAIEHQTGGGLRVIANDVLTCDRGYFMNWSSNGGSSQVVIIGNLFDSNTVSGVEFGEAAPYTTGTFTNAIISNNYFNSDATRPAVGVLISSTVASFLIGPIITDNWIEGATAAGVYGIDLIGTSGILANISGNTIHGQTNNGIRIGPNLSSIHIGVNNVPVGSGVAYTFTTLPLANYLPTKLFVGAPNDSLTLTEQLLLPNAQYLAGRNAAGNAQSKLIGQDASDIVQVASSGQSVAVGNASGSLSVSSYATSSNCSSNASPAVCGASAAGSANITVGTNVVQIQTSKITANSQIIITLDESLGTKLGVTCNTGASSGGAYVNARGAGAFNVATGNNKAAATNPICFSWTLINLMIMPQSAILPGNRKR